MKTSWNLFYAVIFCYFATLSADMLHIEMGLFKIKANNLIAAAMFVILGCSRRGIVIPREVLAPFAAIFTALFLSACGSIYVERCLGYVAVYLFEFAVYFLVPYTLLFHFNRDKILKCYFFSFVAIGMYAFCQLLFSMAGIYFPLIRQFIDVGGWVRPQGLSYEPSFYALYMCAYTMFVNAFYILSKENLSKVVFVNGLLLLSTATSAFFAYGIFIPLMFCFYSYAENFKKKLVKLSVCIGSFLGLLFVAAPKMVLFFFKFFIYGFFTHHSFSERWTGIVNAWSVFCNHPFLGVGIGGIGPYLFYREEMGFFPENSFGLDLSQAELYDPKNVATEILAGLGIFGAAAFALLGWVTWKSFRKARELPEKQRSIVLSLFISFFVMILVLQFNSGLFRCYVWVHLAITLGYSACSSSKSQPSAMSQEPSLS